MFSLLVFVAAASLVFAWREYRRAQSAERELSDVRYEQARLAETTGEQVSRTDAVAELNAALNEEVETHRREAARLRLSEERYALAARGANDGLWDWNLASGAMYYSERWAEMVGEVSRPLAPNAEEWFSRVHLSDLPQLKVDIAAQAAGARSHFLSEHRLRHADGYFIWVLCRGIVVRDTEGRALRIAGSMTDITPRKDLEERLRREAQFDTLTALPNRGYATDLLRRAIARAKRSKDHAGDAMLRMMAGRLSACVRPGDVVARIGGDEFVVILEGVRDEEEAVTVAQRIQESLTLPFFLDGRELFMSVSVGIAMNQPNVDRPEDYLRDADLAMYRAKTGGRARHEIFRPDMRSGAVLQLSIESDLRHALERGELRVMYQPIWALATGKIAGFEALVRWDHPTHGAMQPSDFIPIAEETGLILPLGAWVLRQAAERIAAWRSGPDGDPSLWMSVNVSAKQLTNPGLVEVVKYTIEQTQIPAACLKLEITESMIMADAVAAVGALEALKALGIHLLMDDFGTGHASLSYLHRLPISTIKIDRYFVGRIDSNSECLEIVRTILNLSRSLKMDVIAEGVENAAQSEVLQALGCEYVQGYLMSPPLDADGAERILATHRVIAAAIKS
jgi:PAS domain S-box-containing protein